MRAYPHERLRLARYKTELAQVRDAQLGAIQSVLGDRAQAVEFTIPRRDSSRAKRKKAPANAGTTGEPAEDEPGAAPTTEEPPA